MPGQLAGASVSRLWGGRAKRRTQSDDLSVLLSPHSGLYQQHLETIYISVVTASSVLSASSCLGVLTHSD